MQSKTDLERLWAVKSGELTGRGVGKTYAACHDVACTVFAGDLPYIIGEVKNEKDVGRIVLMLHEVFSEYNLILCPSRGDKMQWHAGGKVIRFVASLGGSVDENSFVRGLSAYHPVSFVDY